MRAIIPVTMATPTTAWTVPATGVSGAKLLNAAVAAKAILGRPSPYHAVPWFWSNQYDLKLQTVGLLTRHDQAILRGDPATRSFSVVYLKAGRILALDCFNAVKDYVQGRALAVNQARIEAASLVDPGRPLKDLAVMSS